MDKLWTLENKEKRKKEVQSSPTLVRKLVRDPRKGLDQNCHDPNLYFRV